MRPCLRRQTKAVTALKPLGANEMAQAWKGACHLSLVTWVQSPEPTERHKNQLHKFTHFDSSSPYQYAIKYLQMKRSSQGQNRCHQNTKTNKVAELCSTWGWTGRWGAGCSGSPWMQTQLQLLPGAGSSSYGKAAILWHLLWAPTF